MKLATYIKQTKQYMELGFETLAAMAINRELKVRHLWLALRGSGKYADAIVSGDVAEPMAQEFRCSECATKCKSRREYESAEGIIAIYCGPRLDQIEGDRPTCGCLVAVRVDGQLLPAGKTIVRSESCPQGKWGAT